MVQSTQVPTGHAESTTSCAWAREGLCFVIKVDGDLDGVAVQGAQFDAALSNYRSGEPLDVVLDVGGVTFLDSVGLSWLMTARSAAALADRRVRLRGCSPAVGKVLDKAQLRRYFPAESRLS